MPKTQRCIGGNAALTVNNAGDTIYRHIDLARELGSRDAHLAQFFGKMFTGMDGSTRHQIFLSMTKAIAVSSQSRRMSACSAKPENS
jgi:hypothetical protein